ncbi:hypothetical protein AB0H12_39275 [Actinosynnema sp. NPDC023794]
MNSAVVFLLGMAGALAPEVVRLYAIRQNPTKFKWSWFYLLVSVAYGALGGVIALVLPATTYWAALYVGVSTPVLVNTIVRKGKESGQTELKGPGNGRKDSHVDSYLKGL